MFSHYVFFENCVNPLPTTLLKETVQFILFGLFLVHPIFSSFGFWFFGILVTLVAWFSYCFFPSCSSRLAKCKQQLHNIFVFLQLHRQKWPKSKNEKWDERDKSFLPNRKISLSLFLWSFLRTCSHLPDYISILKVYHSFFVYLFIFKDH